MRTNFIITLALVSSLIFSGCAATESANNNQYRKVSFYADVSLTHIPEDLEAGRGLLVCMGNGTLSSIMYFDNDGGEFLQQESNLKLTSITCENFGTTKPCTAWTEPTEISIPITLHAELTPDGITSINSKDETTMQDQFTFYISEPVMNPVDITYDCGGDISTLSDYGATFSQLTLPFSSSIWDFGISTESPRMTTFEEYENYGNMANIEFGILEEFTDSIN